MDLSRRVVGLGLCVGLAGLVLAASAFAGQTQDTSANVQSTAAPRWIQFSGLLKDSANTLGPGVTGITFALFKEQDDDAPLWLENQNILVDDHGRYSALLGAGSKDGLPLEFFSSGEARWLGIRVGDTEQARILLVSVPYALNAANAETLGGRPVSDFMLVPSASHAGDKDKDGKSKTEEGDKATQPLAPTVTGSGTTGKLPKWTDGAGAVVGDSVVAELNGNIGIGTATPATKLHLLTNNGGDANATFENLAPGVASYLTIKANSPFAAGIFQTATDRWAFGRFGGANEFGIKDITGAELSPFVIQAGAPNNSFYITGTINGNPGRVGVGTFTPFNKMDVAGNMAIGAYAATNSAPANGLIVSGNVGIGTNAPTQKLDVAGTLKVGGAGIVFPDASTLASANAARIRGITYLAGCDTCSLLTPSDNQAMIYENVIGDQTILSVKCYSDAATPQINLNVNGVPIITGATTCSTGGATLTIDPTKTQMLAGQKMDFVMVNAGNQTHRISVVIKTSVN